MLPDPESLVTAPLGHAPAATVPPGGAPLDTAPSAAPAPPGGDPLDQLAAVAELETVLDEVDDALRRLDDGTYGTCEACGGPIADDRLAAQPTAVTCERHPQLREQDREPDAAAPTGVEPPAALHLGEAAPDQGPEPTPAP